MPYTTPKSFHQHKLDIKKSRFIAWAEKVTNRQEAMAFLERSKQTYPDAGHHCWAYQLGHPQSPISAAMSDDGEPSGTAGKPILNVLQHKNIGDVMVIVIRYFGGIKLGPAASFGPTAQPQKKSCVIWRSNNTSRALKNR